MVPRRTGLRRQRQRANGFAPAAAYDTQAAVRADAKCEGRQASLGALFHFRRALFSRPDSHDRHRHRHAGFVDAIVGGGGLILVPALFGAFPNAPPATLLGSNKATCVWGTGWAPPCNS